MSTIVTNVWVSPEQPYSLICQERPSYSHFWAKFKTPTVRDWWDIKPQASQDLALWDTLLISSNLGCEVRNFRPASIPTELLKPIWGEIFLSKHDEMVISRQCSQLWWGPGSTVKNPHPMLEIAVNAMSMAENYKCPYWNSVADMPNKVYQSMRLVSNLYSSIMETNRRTEQLKNFTTKGGRLNG